MSDPVAPEAPKPGLQIDWKHVVIGVLSVLGALGYGGVLPTAGGHEPAPCSADPSFQADVRAALAKQTDALSDLRERMARVEAQIGAVR